MLGNRQIAAYRRDGFIVVEGVLSAAEVAALRRATDDIAPHRPSRKLYQRPWTVTRGGFRDRG